MDFLRKKTIFSGGFTIIEMLIVTTLTVLLVVTGTSLFLTTIVGGGRANTSTVVKTNGDYALGQMEYLLRNSIALVPLNPADLTSACAENMSQIRLKLIDQGITTLFSEAGKIASNSGIYLTSDSVQLVSGPEFDCSRSADRAITTIRISFTLRKGQAGTDRLSEIQQQAFSTSVTVRSQ